MSDKLSDQEVFIQQDRTISMNVKESNNFSYKNVLHLPHYSYLSYFYSNTTTILNKFVMSYEEQLHRAISKGNYDLCKLLILKKCDVNKELNRKCPLNLACENNQCEIAQLLIENGAALNQLDQFNRSPLLIAVEVADFTLIEMLIKFDADVNLSDSNGTTPLHAAINRKNDDICDFLLNKGALINTSDKQGNTPLALAVSNHYLYMVNKLLELGADSNFFDNNGDSPLIKAIGLTMNANIENESIKQIVKTLIEHGVDIDAKNENGRTALFTAIYQNNTEIALYLIEKNATCELKDNLMSNFTLLHYACFQGNYVLAKALLEKKCDPNALSSSNEITKGYCDIVNLLIDNHADPNILIGSECDNKTTVLHAAVFYLIDYENSFKIIIEKLIEGNANLALAIPGPILYICLQYNKIKFAKFLLSRGAPVNQRTISKQSCFYKAFLIRNHEFMEMCLNDGYNLRKNEQWIISYLDNPSLASNPNYFLHNQKVKTDSNDVEVYIRNENEIVEMLSLDDYYNQRYHQNKNTNIELTKKIYSLIRYNYFNPLSLKQLARIQIRKSLISIDYKIKTKILRFDLPNSLKSYLLLEEYNL